jgi:transposase
MRDREEWAQKQRDQYEERVRIIRARAEVERQEMRKREKEAAEYRQMVEQMLAELYRKNPEWAERKEKLQQVCSHALYSFHTSLNFLRVVQRASEGGADNTRTSPPVSS